MIVADASVLIALAKIGRVNLLREVYDVVVIGPTVRREVVEQGRAIGARGVEYVEDAMHKGWLKEVKVTARERRFGSTLLQSGRLDAGEAESLAIAHERKLAIILDDKEARTAAAILALPHVGTAGVLLKAFLDGRITFSGLEEAVRDLCGVIWLSPLVVAEILKRAREAKR